MSISGIFRDGRAELKSSLSRDDLASIGDRIWREIPARDQVHLVVILGSGASLAFAAFASSMSSRIAAVTVVKREYGFDLPDIDASQLALPAVIVDLRIRTGATAFRVISVLKSQGVSDITFVRLFSSGGPVDEQRIGDRLASAGVRLVTCFAQPVGAD